MKGQEIVERFVLGDTIQFSQANFPVGSYVMGSTGNVLLVTGWSDDGVRASGVKCDAGWEENPLLLFPDASGNLPGETKIINVSADSFEATGGEAWFIDVETLSVGSKHEEEDAPPAKGIVIPEGFDDPQPTDGSVERLFVSSEKPEEDEPPMSAQLSEDPEDEPEPTQDEIDILNAIAAPDPEPKQEEPSVDVPDALVYDGDPPTGDMKIGPYPASRKRTSKLYNYVHENSPVLAADVYLWAFASTLYGKGEKQDAIPSRVAGTVEELRADDWDIRLVNEGREDAMFSIGPYQPTGKSIHEVVKQTVAHLMNEEGVEYAEVMVTLDDGIRVSYADDMFDTEFVGE